MAKDKKASKAPEKTTKKAATTTVTVADLATEFDLEPRKVRMVIRALGKKAPAVEVPAGGFGPKSKYGWDSDSDELAEIRTALGKVEKPAPKAPKADKKKKAAAEEPKSKKKAKPADEDEDEADDEDESDEDDSDDEDEEDEE